MTAKSTVIAVTGGLLSADFLTASDAILHQGDQTNRLQSDAHVERRAGTATSQLSRFDGGIDRSISSDLHLLCLH